VQGEQGRDENSDGRIEERVVWLEIQVAGADDGRIDGEHLDGALCVERESHDVNGHEFEHRLDDYDVREPRGSIAREDVGKVRAAHKD